MNHYPHSMYHELISHGKQLGRLSTARQDDSWDSCKEDNKPTPSAAEAHGTGTILFIGIVQQNALLQYSSKCSIQNLFTHFPGTTVQGT
jgi:hypothetical protein